MWENSLLYIKLRKKRKIRHLHWQRALSFSTLHWLWLRLQTVWASLLIQTAHGCLKASEEAAACFACLLGNLALSADVSLWAGAGRTGWALFRLDQPVLLPGSDIVHARTYVRKEYTCSSLMKQQQLALELTHESIISFFFPTNPFTILELQNPWHDVPQLHKMRRSPDLQALKLWKGSSGSSSDSNLYILGLTLPASHGRDAKRGKQKSVFRSI